MPGAPAIGRIIDDLARYDTSARAQAERNAKAAFLDWVVSLPLDADFRRAARNALVEVDRTDASTIELDFFRSYLETAARPLPPPAARSGRRRRSPQPGSRH